MMASLQLDTRSDISGLENAYPDLAQQFRDVPEQLDRASNLPKSEFATAFQEYRHSLSTNLDDFIGNIRCMLGFEQFVLGQN